MRRRWGVMWLGLGTVLAPALFHQIERTLAIIEVRREFADLPGTSVASVALSADRRWVTLDDIRLAFPDCTVSVGQATLRRTSGLGPEIVEPAAAASASIALDDIRITSGKLLVVVPHADVSGSPLSAADFAAIFDTSLSGSLQERLANFTAAAIRAPVVTLSRPAQSVDGDIAFTFHDVVLNDASHGVIGALAALDMTATGAAMEPSTSFSVGALKAAQLDLPLMLRMVQGARADLAEPVHPLLRSFSIDSIAVKAPDSDMKIASFQLDEVRARPLLLSFADMQAIADKPSEQRTPTERQHYAEAVVDAVKSIAFDRIETDDLNFRSDKDNVAFRLGAAIVEGLDASRLKRLALEQVSLSSTPADMMIGRVALEGYDQARLVDAIGQQAGMPFPDDFGGKIGQVAPTFGNLSLRAVRVDVQADDLKGNARQGRRNVFDVPIADLTIGRALDTGTSAVAHAQLIYDVAPDAPDAGLHQLVEMGYPNLDLSLDYRSTWGEAIRTFTLQQIAVAAQGMGSVAVSATIGNVAPELFNAPGTDATAALAQDVEVRAVRLDLVNAGLAAKLWAMAATSAGVSVPLLKAETKGQVQAAVLQALGNTPAATRVVTAVSTFIDDPKSLMLSVKAPPGLSIKTAMDSGGDRTLIDRLDIDADAGR